MGARQSCSKACSNCTADCTRSGQGYGDDLDDEHPGGDPAGATFEETLEDLGSLDRQLMHFCATSNLSAVRWLLHLGAHWDACDANSTTCLHVACRAGALAVVKEIMQYRELLEAADVAGWTPLHIAVLMGRREVVVRLLQAGAPLHARNSKEQEPAELCADNGTYEAIRSFELHQQQSPGRPWHFAKDTGPSEDIIGSRLQYEPFFVPRQPVIRSQQYKKDFQRIGQLMFNRQPGVGLAFLVASGAVRDYPVDITTFLRRSKVDIKQVGHFLGEAFSLSHTIRLEFINSVVLQNTGVVSALIQVLHMLQLPDDLQKINRLVHGVARIWWRQHERMVKKDLDGNPVPKVETPGRRECSGGTGRTGGTAAPAGGAAKGPQLHLSEELMGLELKQYFTSSDALHQTMFSTVLLHWHMYKDGTGPRKEMDYGVWKQLNVGIETESGDVPEHVQLQIHNLVVQAFIPELAVATANERSRGDAAGGPDEGGGHGPGDEQRAGAGGTAAERPRATALSPFAAAEGWAQMVGGGFPRPSGLTGVNTVTYRHVSSIFSEVTHSNSGLPRSPLAAASESALNAPLGERGLGGVPAEVVPSRCKRDDLTWLSLCYTLLFFSASPQTGAPYAFVELRKVCVASMDEEANILSLTGAPEPPEGNADLAAAGGADAAAPNTERSTATKGGPTPIAIVLLLPDGRWQELSIQKLDLWVPTALELRMWANHLSVSSTGALPRRTTLSKPSPRQPTGGDPMVGGTGTARAT